MDRERPTLALVRTLWVGLALLGLGIVIASFPTGAPGPLKGAFAALDGAQMAGFVAAAAIIFWRRSDDWVAIAFSGMLLAMGVTNATITNNPAPSPLLRAFEVLTDFLSLLVLYFFPDGRFVPRWTVAMLAPYLAYLVANQLGLLPGVATEDILDLMFLGTGILAQAHRYRRVSTPTQQQQIKWLFLGGSTVILATTVLEFSQFIVPIFFGQSDQVSQIYEIVRAIGRTLALLILPVSVAVSVLRYRLWDIDFYINRSLVYAGVTLVLGLIFFGSALLLQDALRRASGGGRSPVALTAAAVLIAILFQPTRQRLQSFIDRQFYGIRPYAVEERPAEGLTQALVDPLSEREMDVLKLINVGLTNQDISEQLFITVGTVKWHTNNIYTKLGVNSRTQALARARDLNLLF